MTAEVRGYLPDECDGVVVVLHGGAETSLMAVQWWNPAVLRMLPFAWAVRRAAGPRVGVLRVRNELLGWNGHRQSPLDGTRWALDQVRAAHPDTPIVLVGHSMGGRVTLNLAGEQDVVGVAALAPWIVESDGVHAQSGQRALLMHGRSDRITDPALTERYAERLRARDVDVRLELLPNEGHAMLMRAPVWHRTVAEFATTTLSVQPRSAAR
ncbi:alpha/beta hydrolase [Cumulibacter manganitolerans]|uniref:alpha/beta hydrolase n=1 Tax=Cumulibacter manganitolerans TaxID=1884992 RepID=UPI001885ABDF|nr:alpha/beta fold hydrolase [Cumulibacter manganitolerans]